MIHGSNLLRYFFLVITRDCYEGDSSRKSRCSVSRNLCSIYVIEAVVLEVVAVVVVPSLVHNFLKPTRDIQKKNKILVTQRQGKSEMEKSKQI